MNSITTSTGKVIIAVELHEVTVGATGFYISEDGHLFCNELYSTIHDEKVPKDSQIVDLLSNLTVTQAREYVESEWDGTAYWYKNYEGKTDEMIKRDAIKSFKTLLISNGLDITKPVLIMEIQKTELNP